MKKLLFIAIASYCVISCSNDLSENNKNVENKILTFNSIDEFTTELNNLSKELSEEKIVSWSKLKNSNSLLLNELKTGKVNNDLPLVMKAILNSNSQFRLGNKFITYSKGNYYETNSYNESLKKNNIIGKVEISYIEKDDDTIFNNRVLSSNGSYKEYYNFNREQYQIGCGTPINKPLEYNLVHEIKAIKSSVQNSAYSELSMNFRMSYNSGGGWGDATQTERILSFSLNGNVQRLAGSIQSGGGNSSFNISGNYSCGNPAKGNRRYVLAGMSFVNNYGSDPSWNVNISGNISHQVNGDWQNGYDVYISW